MNITRDNALHDPRLRFDFNPALFPACDGAAPPELDEWDNESPARMRLEFVAAYYEINRCYRDLVIARKPSPSSEQQQRAALHAIEQAILKRDALEDKYASKGILATPVLAQGVITDIQFVMPRPAREQPSLISMCFTVCPAMQDDCGQAIMGGA